MSVTDIKENIKGLSNEERCEIANFISHLRITEEPDYWSRIKRRINDKHHEHWVSLEEIISPED